MHIPNLDTDGLIDAGLVMAPNSDGLMDTGLEMAGSFSSYCSSLNGKHNTRWIAVTVQSLQSITGLPNNNHWESCIL